MGSLFLQKGMLVWICLFSLRLVCGYSEVAQGSVFIDGKNAIGRIDNNFICATLDWWPPEKCDYGTCAWDHASFLNLVLFSWLHFPFLVSFSTVLMCRNTLSFLTVVSESACAHLDLEMLLWCSSVKFVILSYSCYSSFFSTWDVKVDIFVHPKMENFPSISFWIWIKGSVAAKVCVQLM